MEGVVEGLEGRLAGLEIGLVEHEEAPVLAAADQLAAGQQHRSAGAQVGVAVLQSRRVRRRIVRVEGQGRPVAVQLDEGVAERGQGRAIR